MLYSLNRTPSGKTFETGTDGLDKSAKRSVKHKTVMQSGTFCLEYLV